MDRREVRLRRDAGLGKARDDAVTVDALAEQDDVDEPGALVVVVVGQGRLDALERFEQLRVARGSVRAKGKDLVEALELRETESGREVVEAVVVAQVAVVSQPPSSVRPWFERLFRSVHSCSLATATAPPSPVVICLFG